MNLEIIDRMYRELDDKEYLFFKTNNRSVTIHKGDKFKLENDVLFLFDDEGKIKRAIDKNEINDVIKKKSKDKFFFSLG